MTARSKSARKTHVRPAGRRAKRGRRTQQTVTPVATQASTTGADAVIPVSVQGEGSSAEAVIPVEVATGGRRRRRAAVVPIAVHRRSAHSRRGRTGSSKRQSESRSRAGRKFEPAYPKPWRTFASEAVNSSIDIEQAALELGLEYGQTAIAVVQSILWPILGRPADLEPVGRGEVLVQNTPAEIAGAAIAWAA
jgi:hypothetical protein